MFGLVLGPTWCPIYVSGVSRASTITVDLTYNPAVLRVRTMQEGSFLRQGGTNVVFTPNTEAATGRIDLAFVRTGDAVGASGSGLLVGDSVRRRSGREHRRSQSVAS